MHDIKSSLSENILKRLEKKGKEISKYVDSNDIEAILHELDVYGAELLAQNEELLEKERALEDAKNEFEVLFLEAPIAYVVVDKKGIIHHYNRVADQYFYFSLSSIKKKSFLTYIKSKYITTVFDLLEDKADEATIECKINYEVSSQSLNYFLINKRNYKRNDNHLIMLALSNIQKEHDKQKEIKEIKEEQIRQQEILLKNKDILLVQQSKMAAMGEMIGAIAHNWRQPLNLISLQSQSLIYKLKKQDLDKELLTNWEKNFKDQVNYMSDTISDFQSFFSPSESTETQKLSEIIDRCLSLLDSQLKHHSIEVRLYVDENIVVRTNTKQLQQAIINIISNSKDAIDSISLDGGYITIDAKEDKQEIELSITDSGGGVADTEDLIRIFEPYFTKKEQGKGTGIGLYMTKMIIENNLKGSISAKNTIDGLEMRIKLSAT